MNERDRKHLDELAWIAFMAQQMGWDSLAERIDKDIVDAEKRNDELDRRRRDANFGKDDERDSDSAAA